MSAFSFSIGGIEITESDVWALNVEMGLIEGSATLRTQNGTLTKQIAWSKYGIKIVCEGHYLPAALNGLDYSAALEFVSSQGVTEGKATAASITTNHIFRQDTDYQPVVFAILADGSKSSRVSAITGAQSLGVTLTGGEISLIVLYYPILQMYFSPPEQNWNQFTARSGWVIKGEEI